MTRIVTHVIPSPLGWALMSEPDEILPFNDIAEHRCATLWETCTCGAELNDDGTIVHNAFDGREAYVEGRRKRH